MVEEIEKIQEMFNKELEDLKNKQMNDTITRMKIYYKESTVD